MDQYAMLPNCTFILLYRKINSNEIISCRNCLAVKKWTNNWMNCSCLPQCDSVDYTIVNRRPHTLIDRDSRQLEVNTYVTKSRIKRDLLFSIDYLIGRYRWIVYLFHFIYIICEFIISF